MENKIAILGDGGWGTTLAIHLSRKGLPVCLWSAFKDYAVFLDKRRSNIKFLPGIKIPADIRITHDLEEAVGSAGVIVVAVPSHFFRGVVIRLKKFDLKGKIILSVTKGIECATLLRMSQIIERELKGVKCAVLSGPTIAREVAEGIPTTAVIACRQAAIAGRLQKIFNSNKFRIYTNSDMVGVELGGSLKNIIAIACGVSDGLSFGANTKAAILCRGLAEISRLGSVMGARPRTFAGLSGLGDLVTTCISPLSRNRYVGEQLGKGKGLREILKKMDMVAEGVETAKSAYRLSLKHKVSMPITSAVYGILYRHKKPLAAVKDLMARSLKPE
jgi:glycerol-3-phosphate dehydrogenase (NAD(P)+)